MIPGAQKTFDRVQHLSGGGWIVDRRRKGPRADAGHIAAVQVGDQAALLEGVAYTGPQHDDRAASATEQPAQVELLQSTATTSAAGTITDTF